MTPVLPIVPTTLVGRTRANIIHMVMISSVTVTKEWKSNCDSAIALTELVILRGVKVVTWECSAPSTRPL